LATHFSDFLLPTLLINPFSVKNAIALATDLSGMPDAAEISFRVLAAPSPIASYTFDSVSLRGCVHIKAYGSPSEYSFG
jgi:hypothetical protein